MYSKLEIRRVSPRGKTVYDTFQGVAEKQCNTYRIQMSVFLSNVDGVVMKNLNVHYDIIHLLFCK